ncbi:MAG: type III-B CRISPR module RAMP protein Cmr1 [Aquificae bacterium]|nr:type III-B CRISPR module RAMP protein Cmr1 [Aquificota bacterium]
MALYEKLEYKLEFITPAFIGGAFPDKEAELRPASFIGILRWWFRNLALTVTDNLEAIYKLESELFGNTERAGKVWVRFEELKKFEYQPLSENAIDLDLAYLGYGVFDYINCSRNFHKHPHVCRALPYLKGFMNTKAFIPIGEIAKVEVFVPKRFLELIRALFNTVALLGSIGGRNRRGWGSFHLHPKGEKIYWNSEALTINFFKNELLKLTDVEEKPFQTINVYIKKLQKGNALDALKKLGCDYRSFRSRLQPDYFQAKNFLTKRHRFKTLIYNRAWFGLPIKIQYRSLNGKGATINLFEGKEHRRLASPLIFKVVKSENGKYDVVLILMNRPKFIEQNGRFYSWNFGQTHKVLIKADKDKTIKPNYVVMDESFSDFVVETFLKGHLNAEKVISWGK